MTPYDRIKACRRSGSVKRWHTNPTIGEQNVAAHSWNVLVILLELVESPTVRLLTAAIYHDAAEHQTGDLPSQVKRRSAKIKELMDELENAEYQSMDIDMRLAPEEKLLIKTADLLEMLFYIREQRLLGNRSLDLTWNRVIEWIKAAPGLPSPTYELLHELVTSESEPYHDLSRPA